MSITTILTCIVTILVSIEQENTPLDQNDTDINYVEVIEAHMQNIYL